ncbi:MAG: TIGR03557 family F420-dependent LLM class oxidoreductase [Candidatus Binatia bacterium]
MKVAIGYSLSSEETAPNTLVRYAQRAEDAGFSFALISDHFHPWINRQGQSPFVWSVIGAIAQATRRLSVGTGVTCPILRIHPAIIAQAAATAAVMMEGRFFLGVGTGENLNEHILGVHWPPRRIRQEMLAEAINIIRLLWRGGMNSHQGRYFTVEQAQIFTLPDEPPPILIAAASIAAAEFAGTMGDGLISTVAQEHIVKKFRASNGSDSKPCIGQMTVCWAKKKEEAQQIAYEWWPVSAIPGNLLSSLATPAEFESVAHLVSSDNVAANITSGPDAEEYLDKIRSYSSAGFDRVYLHQIGPDQEGFFQFCAREILPRMA